MKINTDFADLELDILEKSVSNVGSDVGAEYSLLRAGGQLGELAEIVAISENEYDMLESDEKAAVGMTIVFLADTCGRSHLDMQQAVKNARIAKSYGHIDDRQMCIRVALSAYGELCGGALYSNDDSGDDRAIQESNTNLGSVILALEQFCALSEYTFDAVINDAHREFLG